MHVRKRIFAFLLAALAMALLTACGKWDYSREAMKAANGAQGENVRVTFEIDQKFTTSLRGAAEDNIQPADVKNAMAMDKTIEKLLTSGYRLDIYALRADTDAAKAAAQLADEFVSRLAGCEEKGYISMVKADNGYFYEAVLVYRHGGNGGTDDSSEPAKTITGGKITGEPTNKEYNVGDPFKPAGLQIELTYSDGSTETIDLNASNSFCTDEMRGCKESVKITYGDQEYTYKLPEEVTVTPTKDDYGESALLTTSEFNDLKGIVSEKAEELNMSFGGCGKITDEVKKRIQRSTSEDHKYKVFGGIKTALMYLAGERSSSDDESTNPIIEPIIEYHPGEHYTTKQYSGRSFDELSKELNAIKPTDYEEYADVFDAVYMYIIDGQDENGQCIIECYFYFIDYLDQSQI